MGSLRGILQHLFSQGPYAACRELLRCAARTAWAGRMLYRMARGCATPEPLVLLCQEVKGDLRRLYGDPHCAFYLVQQLMGKQQYERVIQIVTPLTGSSSDRAKLYGVRGMANLQLGRYQEALADLTRCHELLPKASRDWGFNYQRAFLHGLRGDVAQARQAMRDQMPTLSSPDDADSDLQPIAQAPAPNEQDGEGRPGESAQCASSALACAADRPAVELARFLHDRLAPLLGNLDLRGSVGVFFGVYPNALGHAILDPFHYVNLFGGCFDNLIMVHSNLTHYTSATRLTLNLLEPHVETILCTDSEVLNFAWQHLGELQHENFTFLLYNYWALNRLAFKSRQDATHALHHGRRYFHPAPKLTARAEALLRRNNVEINGPLVVMHSREHGYHELREQSYRNTNVRNYVPALRKLIALGYTVVRVGDRKMTSLRREIPGLIELPVTDFYSPVLDPYLISRCEFMISCQSGPCSYARAFGKPNLVLNAVYHYTLLPEHQELMAFKNYRSAATKEQLSVEEIFQAGAHLFDHTRQFVEQGIEVVDMTPEEIEAAVDEMLDWLKHPDRPETKAQGEFRRLMNLFGQYTDPNSRLATPMTDYVGYALPECRLSDAVTSLRPGYLRPAEPCILPVSQAVLRAA
jgi:putative glycosyltransferase (TIGR04372 family)